MDLHFDSRILLDDLQLVELKIPHSEWLASEPSGRQSSARIGYLGREGVILDMEELEVIEFESVRERRERVRLICVTKVHTPMHFVEKISEADHWATIWAHPFPRGVSAAHGEESSEEGFY